MNNNQMSFDPNTGQPIQNGQNMVNNQMPQQPVNPMPQQQMNPMPENKKSPLKIVLIVVGVVVLLGIIIFCLIIFGVMGSSNKLVCTSPEGNITIMYNDTHLTGYTTKGMTYDYDGQKAYADEIGLESYLSEFENWFKTNTTGSCVRK